MLFMEVAATNLVSSTSPLINSRNLIRNQLSPPSSSTSCSSSAIAVNSIPTTSVARTIPVSIPLQEQRDEFRSLLHLIKGDIISQATLNRKQMESATITRKGGYFRDSERFLEDLEYQHHHSPGSWYLFPSISTEERQCSSMHHILTSTDKVKGDEVSDVVMLAKKALLASKKAAALAESKLLDTDLGGVLPSSLEGADLLDLEEERKTVRSTRLLERRSRRRKMAKSKVDSPESSSFRRADVKKKLSGGFDLNDPVRLFLSGPDARQLLTAEEESELILQIQDLIKLEQVKSKIQSQFNREPTLLEWAQAAGLSCRVLKSQLHFGYSCREKLIQANLRMVVHIAKQYQNRGLSLQDLLQEGSMGLMKSVEKFKLQIGCRFATYAYWWIRQAVRKAIFQHSRTIRLPENVYTLLGKVTEAKRSFIQEGNHDPSKELLAHRVGISVDRLEKLLFVSRTPISMQQPVWSDQETTFQEITADTEIESPDMSVSKQLMRRHVRSLLKALSPKERRIVKLRYGIDGGEQKSLSEIGIMFGLSKERVRQLEIRALYKLKQGLQSEGLDAYEGLLI